MLFYGGPARNYIALPDYHDSIRGTSARQFVAENENRVSSAHKLLALKVQNV